jgi:DNA-binding transcriptional LysR family regulator
MTMDLRSDRLEVFLAVIDGGGFSAAARALHCAQSSVSQTIAALEVDLGDSVFVRDGRKVRLTPAGRVLEKAARDVQARLGSARDELTALRDGTHGTLSIGASDTFSTWVLPPVFSAFRRAYPRVELRLDNRPSPAIAELVASGELDVGVVSLPLPAPNAAVSALVQLPLAPQRDVVIVPRRHPLSTRQRVKLEDLEPYPLVLLDRSTASRAWLDARFAEAGLTPTVAMEMNSIEVLKRLVSLGFGLSIVPEVAVSAHDAVVPLALTGVEHRRQIGLLSSTTPTRAARAFTDVARQVLKR